MVALAGCGVDDPPSAGLSKAEVERALKGSPKPLAAIHRQSNQLLGGGKKAFEARLEELRGYPVVVNKWASWCSPCRAEFPHFQRLALRYGKRVAFLGVNSEDEDAAAKKFLSRYPVPFPSYVDGNGRIAASINAGVAFPSTVFIDRKGKVVISHPGQYRNEADLAADIRRYAR